MTPLTTQSPEAKLKPLASLLESIEPEVGVEDASKEYEPSIKEEEDLERDLIISHTPLSSKRSPPDTSSWNADIDLTGDQNDDLVDVKEEIDLTKEIIPVEAGGWNDLSEDTDGVKVKEEIDLTGEIINVDHGGYYDLVSDSDEVDSVKSESEEENFLDQEHPEADGFDDDFDEDFLEQEPPDADVFDDPPDELAELAAIMRAQSEGLFVDDDRPPGESSSFGARDRSIPSFTSFRQRRDGAQDSGASPQQEDNLRLGYDGYSDVSGDEDELSVENRPKKTRKVFKFPREWHRNRFEQMSSAQIRGPAWKQAQIDKLHVREKEKAGKKRRAPKSVKQPAKKQAGFDPAVLLGGGEPAEPRDTTSGEAKNNSTTKKDWWKTFKEQNHGIDIHKCVKDKNILMKQSRSFGNRRVKPVGNRWEVKGMPTRE